MTAKIESEMALNRASREKSWWLELARKSGLFTLFLLCAIAVLILGDNHQTTFPTNQNLYYEGATTAFFLATALMLRRMPHGGSTNMKPTRFTIHCPDLLHDLLLRICATYSATEKCFAERLEGIQ